VDTNANLSTDGIDIQEIRIRKEKSDKGDRGLEKEFTFNTWDFGGQVVFYPTHQFFLSNGAIYVIVFDFSNFKLPRIEYWMKQLKQLNGEGTASLIIMVGTHADQCKEEDISANIDKMLTLFPKRLFPQFQSLIIPVSCNTGLNIKALKEKLVELAEHPSLSPVVSVRIKSNLKPNQYCLSHYIFFFFLS
jgi:GTPase SAR1 family protein